MMTRFSIFLVLCFTVFVQAGAALAADLNANITRRVYAANQSLDKADELIMTGQAALSGNYLSAAQGEYDNIFNYYDGQFDPDHATLTALKSRIDAVAAQAANAKAAAARPAPAPTSVASEPKAETAAAPATAPVPEGSKDLIPNIRRLMAMIEDSLKGARQYIAKGRRAGPAIDKARGYYNQIFKRYTGLFDPNHPDLVAIKARIEETAGAVNAAARAKMASTPVESVDMIVGMPRDMGQRLKAVGVQLSFLYGKLDHARQAEASAARMGAGASKLSPLADNAAIVERQLQDVEDHYARFNGDFTGQFDPGHEAYAQVTGRVAKARQDVAAFRADVGAETQALHAAAADKYQAEVAAIRGRYPNQPPSGKLHAANVGAMVWATREIAMAAQDSIKTQDRFKLTDPIFGRVFLKQFLGNTPVFSPAGGRPGINREFRYEFRLFVDGRAVADKFGVFGQSKLNGKAGETWTTWQFAPHPVPFDDAFKAEADAWRRATARLAPGDHDIRFELWGTQGQFKSLAPISVGEFTLAVGAGERVAAGTAFPADSHAGGDTGDVRAAMRKALVGPVTRNPAEILKVAVTSDWREGVYSDTKRRYRAVSGAVLWQDKDNDEVCRFTTYNFVADHTGGNNWTPVRFKSFCVSCPEGDAECP